MTTIIIVLSLAAALALFRFVPGFKCIGYCKFREYQHVKATTKLKDRVLWNEALMSMKVQDVRLEDLSNKQLNKLYLHTAPFGCKTFKMSPWISDAREILKNHIAERALLE